MSIAASELFAQACGLKVGGAERCHWCAGPCGRAWPHDDQQPLPYVRSRDGAKNPGGPWACEGCRSYRRVSQTAWKLSGGYKDRQSFRRLSWWATPEGAYAVFDEQDKKKLWELALRPPPTFCLALSANPRVDNHLHLAKVNDHEVLTADLGLSFTLDNVAHEYTVYELKEACKFGPEGKSPGVNALWRFLGPNVLPDEKHVEGRRGRPPRHEDDDPRRLISKKP